MPDSTPLELVHTFAANPFDRCEARRRQEDWIAEAARGPRARFLPMAKLNPLVENQGDGARLAWLTAHDAAQLTDTPPPVLLGTLGGVPHFAIDVSHFDDAAFELGLDGTMSFEEARAAAMRLDGAETGILAQARANIGWHQRHGFCSVCGEPTVMKRGGQLRSCPACKADHFPRTDPVVIMLIADGERCLLGQSRGRPAAASKFYSALAGFVDQGESIEEAVRREVMEEAGLTVGAVRYHSSQPWPFPSSLMIGCHGDAANTEINFDTEEMADVRWFTRTEVKAALARTNDDLRVPGAMAIAHHLIRTWANGELGG